MTMLDQMRRHKNWLKLSLLAVVITFIALYIPSFLKGGARGAAAPRDVISSVEGHEVTVGSYQRIYQQQVQALRQNAGGNFDEQMLRQLGIPQRIIQQLEAQQAVLAEAERLGVSVSAAELRERILRMPGFQENGQFFGEARYRQFLAMQRPPMSAPEFEEEIRRSLVAEKLENALTGWMTVSDADVEEEFRKRNEKVKLELAILTATQFRSGIQPTDAELNAYFSAHQDAYKIPEKRRVRYLSIDGQAMRPKMAVTPQEVEARYQQNIQTYSTPEQVRASHILFKTKDKDEAAVRKVAESVLAKAKSGADFAALAKQYSEDEASKTSGGDLDYFGRGTMVKEFDDAAFAMKPGEISDLVKSQFGFHIIKVVDKKAANTRTLAEVRPQIEDQIRSEKAQAEAAKIAADAGKEISSPADFDRVARARSLTVGDSGLFARDEPLAGLGFAPEVASTAFTMEKDKVSGALQTPQGSAFITLVETKPSAAAKLEDVKDKVRDDVIRTKAVEMAKAKATQLAQGAAKGNFAAAAKSAGADVKTTDFVTRGSALPEVGVNSSVDRAVFALKPGQTSEPISTDNAVVVARVTERQDPKPEELATQRDQLRGELLQQRRSVFFSSYMAKAEQKMKIRRNDSVIRTLLAGS